MKYLFLAFALIFIITSCEDDDFCDDPTTPRLTIVFYNKDIPSEKKTVPLYVWAEKKDSIYKQVVTDSIQVPLNTIGNLTEYRLSTTNVIDTLDLGYTTSDIFVSEGCGYIAHFNDFSVVKNTSNWIERLEVNVTKIENETETHIKIFH